MAVNQLKRPDVASLATEDHENVLRVTAAGHEFVAKIQI